jgi:outer membrane receptor for ferrienterochelin and colicins
MIVGPYFLAALAFAQTGTSSTAEPVLEGTVEGIVVTGGRIESRIDDSPVVVEVVSRKEIDESGAENLAEILEEVPGVQVTYSLGKAGVELQGLDPQYTLILVDGQRTTGRVGGTLDLNRFPAERIERVELVKGAVSALYGADALAGVVNIITRRSKKEFEGEVHLSYGSANLIDGTVLAGSSGEKYNLRISAGFHRGDSFQIESQTRVPGDPSTNGPGYNEGNGEIRGEYDLNESDRLILRADYLFRDSTSIAAIPIPQLDETYIFQTFHQGNRTENYSAALTFDRRDTEADTHLQITGYFNGWREQFLQDVRGVKGDQPVDTSERLGQASFQYDEQMNDHMVTFGSELLYEELDASERICRELEPGACIPTSTGEESGRNADNASRVRFASFVQDEWLVFEEPRFVLVPGIRADVDSLFGTYPTPKLTARLDPIDTLTIRASAGFGFRAPSFRELYLSFTNPAANYNVSGNPDLEPETSRSYNAGVDVRPLEGMRVSVSFYRNDLRNLIDFGTVRAPAFGQLGLFEYVNILEAHTQGVETSIAYKPIPELTLGAGYTFLDAINESTGAPLIGRAKHRVDGKVRFEETFTDTVLYSHIEWVSKRPYPTGAEMEGSFSDVPEGPSYVLLDARVEKRFGAHLDVFFGANNLFDASDSQFLLIRPRSFYAGVTGRM